MHRWRALDRESLREELRTNLWFVPLLEVVVAVALFAGTYAIDRAAFNGDFHVPSWALSGSADAARQILTTVAAAIITVVGVVFSIVIVALTLTSTQFGPRMLRNFIRDPGTQVTLGTFVGTFVYAILTLGSIGQESRGNFVPHISITVTLALLVVDLGVLIYFIHHIATQIQLPQVIAGIAGDLARAIEVQAGDTAATAAGPSAAAAVATLPGPGGAVAAPRSGYLQFIDRRTLVRIASRADVVIHVIYRPGHFLVQGHPYAMVWPARKAGVVARELARSHVTGPYRTLAQDVSFGLDQLVEIAIRALSPAVNDTFTAMTCIDWIGDSLCKVTGNWQPTHVYCGETGAVRVITTEPSYERLVRRSFEKIRQAGRGMPAIMIRQLNALTKIMQLATEPSDRRLLLEQAAMIERLASTTVDEESDRADIARAYRALLAAQDQQVRLGAVALRLPARARGAAGSDVSAHSAARPGPGGTRAPAGVNYAVRRYVIDRWFSLRLPAGQLPAGSLRGRSAGARFRPGQVPRHRARQRHRRAHRRAGVGSGRAPRHLRRDRPRVGGRDQRRDDGVHRRRCGVLHHRRGRRSAHRAGRLPDRGAALRAAADGRRSRWQHRGRDRDPLGGGALRADGVQPPAADQRARNAPPGAARPGRRHLGDCLAHAGVGARGGVLAAGRVRGGRRPHPAPGPARALILGRVRRPRSRPPVIGCPVTARITVACLDMAGTTIADEGTVMSAFGAAMEQFGLAPGQPGYERAAEIVHVTMGQSKIEVFRRILGDEASATAANRAFEKNYAVAVSAGAISPLPGAAETIAALRDAGIRVCLATGFSPATRNAVLEVLGWQSLVDLSLSPADAGRGRPWPDLPLTALLRLGGGAVSELAVAGDTASDVESGLRAGAGLVVGVLTGSGSSDELAAAGAHYLLPSISVLLSLVGLTG